MGRALRGGAVGLQVPARRPRDRGRRHGAHRHAVQLLRHGHDRRRYGVDLRQREGSRAHHAAGRRHRARFLDLASQRRAGEGRRRRCLGSAVVHGCVGRDVPHHHERWIAPRRHDGDPALRPSRHRGLRRRQARPKAPAHVQRLGAGDRSLHEGGEGRRRLAAGVRRQGLSYHQGEGVVGAHHARDLRCGRAGCHFHRPRECPEQSPLLRDHSRHKSVRGAAVAILWRLPAGFDQSIDPYRRPVYAGGAARHGGP
jgi:hypothetical protein